MIGAIHPLGCGFKGPVLYAEFGRAGSRQNRVAWAETYNLPTRDLELAACFMGATANGSVSGTRTPVYFISVSFDIDDPVDEAMMGRVARRTLRDMGLEEHEAVVVTHKDRSHPHLHFIVNRVHGPAEGQAGRLALPPPAVGDGDEGDAAEGPVLHGRLEESHDRADLLPAAGHGDAAEALAKRKRYSADAGG